jgi:hypothetical protein
MELTIHIDTNRSLSMEEAKELDIQSRRQGLPPQDLVLGFIRDGLRSLKSDPSTPSTPSLPSPKRKAAAP